MVLTEFLKALRNPERFRKLKDGWVKDELVGVEWGPSSTDRMNWKDANDYCKKQGGRLPEVDELITLVDRSKYNPAINVEIFPDTKSDFYWSATAYAVNPAYAWFVYFYDGVVGSDYKGYDGSCVRPVRSSQ
jgi:hypothetical protein